ncbi:MAG: erythromycin esterase [Acidobacteriota bacterium]|jgi:erythromycin esterase|nr:erythromycin esterase [Acidobacteriota bacterium]
MRKRACRVVALSVAIFFGHIASSAAQQTSPEQGVPAQKLEINRPVERELKAEEVHAYEVTLEGGQFFRATVEQRGIDVVVRLFAPDGTKLAEVDSPNGREGPEPVALEAKAAGTYRVEVSSLEKGAPAGRYEIKIDEVLSAEAYASRRAAARMRQQAVIAWLKANAIPLKTVEAGNGFADLQPLKRVLKDARFVALGEETHGTREFFQFKHRMLEFLVREMGFRVFAIEASYAACQNINDYVMGRTDDGAKALDSQGFWTWNTEEVRAMLDWMRAYNASVAEQRRVKFAGFDIQINDAGKEKLLAYLRRVAPERVAETEEFFKVNLDELNVVLTPRNEPKFKDAMAKLSELKNRYGDLFLFLELNGSRLARQTSPAEYEQMREYARVLVQYLDSYSRAGIGGAVTRDLYMADNFKRLVEREPAGTRFVIWAHNGHVSVSDNGGTYRTMGYHLRRFYGDEYYAVGFSFNRGSFQAREAQSKNPSGRMLRSHTVGAAPEDSIDWYLAQTGVKNFLVDLRSGAKDEAVSVWLAAPHPMRSVGAIYAAEFEQNFFQPTNLRQEYDSLFFIDTTTRARPNPSVKNVAPVTGR